jgi:SynChlorMet cassette protein ScmC
MEVLKMLNDSGYIIKLANNEEWCIIVEKSLMLWVEKLASIMELRKSAGFNRLLPRIILITGQSEDEVSDDTISHINVHERYNLPQNDWKVYDNFPVCLWFHPDVPDVIIEIKYNEIKQMKIMRILNVFTPIFNSCLNSGGMPLHTGLIERNGRGYLLMGPSNTGKSTCCKRIPHPWYPLCDDLTLIVLDDRKRYMAHPFPTWSDYFVRHSERTFNVQKYVPLAGIFFLEQNETDAVLPIGDGQASILLTKSTMQLYNWRLLNFDCKEKTTRKKVLFNNACELAKTVPAYILRVSLEGRFWEEMEKVI